MHQRFALTTSDRMHCCIVLSQGRGRARTGSCLGAAVSCIFALLLQNVFGAPLNDICFFETWLKTLSGSKVTIETLNNYFSCCG